MDIHELANIEADRIEADDDLTDDEKRRYLRELGEEMVEYDADNQNR